MARATPARRTKPGLLGTEARRWGAMLAVFVAAGAVIAVLVQPPPPPPKPKPVPPAVRVAGEPLSLTGDVTAEALDLVRRYAQGEITLTLPEGRQETLRPAELGMEIDRVRLARLVGDAVSPHTPLRVAYDARRAASPDAVLDIPVPLRISTDLAVAQLVRVKDGIDQAASDAVVDLQTKKLLPERWGYRLDVYGTLARLDAALREGRRTVEAAVEKVKPRVVASELGNVQFDEVLGYFETPYSESWKARDRTYNLRIAASRLDGTVLLPGEIFDFNQTVGPRDEAHGYKVATVIAQGELVDGIGGGTCQISGTLHGAAFFAGLEVVERYPHSRPSYYMKLGLDATVVYPTINFRLRNPFPFPVVLHETVKGGKVRAEILGPKRKVTVSFFRRVDEIVPFEEELRETEKLPEGARELAQRGMPGFKATVMRLVREGAYARRTKEVHEYPPTTQIVRVGTGPKKLEAKPSHDSHPEYVADEYLVITQGPGVHSPNENGQDPGGGELHVRVPGRTGRYGWQEKLGMKVFTEEKDEPRGDPGGEKADG